MAEGFQSLSRDSVLSDLHDLGVHALREHEFQSLSRDSVLSDCGRAGR